jgi:DNA-binding NtrC family response regulator
MQPTLPDGAGHTGRTGHETSARTGPATVGPAGPEANATTGLEPIALAGNDPIATPAGSPRPTLLVIDDREDLFLFCRRNLGDLGLFVHTHDATSARQALAEPSGIAAVLVDRDFSHADPSRLLGPSQEVRDEGMHILRWLGREHPGLPAIMVTGYREMSTAVEAADLGYDFLAWEEVTAHPEILRGRLQQVLDRSGGREEEILARFRSAGVVVASAAFRQVLVQVHHALAGNAPILLLGETGTGKDTVAWAAHALTGDSTRPFVAVNVAALNPNLLESELFGHAQGAFTGAERATVGKLRHAHGGTLFLNEIGDLATDFQVKLLTVLDRREVVPVGDVRSFPAEFRLITATSCDLRARIHDGRFREDLYHRLAWHTLEIPPLRDRREDIPALVAAFLRDAGQGCEGGVTSIQREAVECLAELPWRGNVRELRGVIEAAAAVANYTITVKDIRDVMRRQTGFDPPQRSGPGCLLEPLPGAPIATVDLPPAGLLRSPAEANGARAGYPPTGSAGHDCGANVFSHVPYRELTARYFKFLYDASDGRLSEVARRAGIGKATAYEWRERFLGAGDRAGEPDDSGTKAESS